MGDPQHIGSGSTGGDLRRTVAIDVARAASTIVFASREGRETPPTSRRPATVAKTMWPFRATIGLDVLEVMRVQPEDTLMISRRSFLLGLGGIVTSTFVTRAASYARAHDRPLLLPQLAAENAPAQVLLHV